MNIDANDETIQATAEAMQLAALLDTRFGHSDDARVTAWAEQVQRHRLERNDLLDAVQAFYDTRQPYPISIGELLDAARAIRRDRQMREPPQRRIDRPPTPAERETADEMRAVSAAFLATLGPVTNPTERLENARRELQHCYGETEARAAIREFLAAKAEAQRPQKQAVNPVDVRLAQTVRCPWCHAQPGAACTSGTNRTPAGGYHPTRLDDARKASIR